MIVLIIFCIALVVGFSAYEHHYQEKRRRP